MPPTVAVYYGDTHEYYKSGLLADIAFSRFSDTRVFTAGQLAERRAQKDPAYVMSVGEYEAMVWLRDNTPPDAVVADTRYIYNNKYFNGTAFSERSFYLEGWGYVTMEDSNSNTPEKIKRDTLMRQLFDFKQEGVCAMLYDEGCDYLVVSEYMMPGFTVSEKFGTLVYENDDARIYRLKAF